MDPISSGRLAWAQADWRPRCPFCEEVLEEFTSHTMICDEHSLVDASRAVFKASPWGNRISL